LASSRVFPGACGYLLLNLQLAGQVGLDDFAGLTADSYCGWDLGMQELNEMDDLGLNLAVLLLLGVANGTPIFAKALLKDRFSAQLDGGLMLPDGQPLLGPSKTIRGLLVSVTCTALVAELLGLGWSTGSKLAALSMLGDLGSSFLKRRLRLPPHAQAFGLDQIPEALVPLLVLRAQLGLDWLDVAVLIIGFIILEIWLSRLLFMLHIRDRPY
jgi:CDP-2,3-bis-(O-geranylgeranyl)-sn-glycerol synthase